VGKLPRREGSRSAVEKPVNLRLAINTFCAKSSPESLTNNENAILGPPTISGPADILPLFLFSELEISVTDTIFERLKVGSMVSRTAQA
ncbi:hypothetical protein, partial [Escherichia coli]|uniref:hypothetical protein n=1 Tax=Escherichia coli TaxID=562 RepID=UPI0029165CBD